MKALMTNSTHPDIFAAKIRDQMYIKHLREVQKINNRQAQDLKENLKHYHYINESYQKSKRKARQFELSQQNLQIQKKNDLIIDKIKNIRSMFSIKNGQKSAQRSQSVNFQDETIDQKMKPESSRYQKQNDQKQQINQISQQISDNLAIETNKGSKADEGRNNRKSLHYYLRKRQQELIQQENQKLMKGILSQKSVYSPNNKKNSLNIKLPQVKSARHNFNQKTKRIQNNIDKNQKDNNIQ